MIVFAVLDYWGFVVIMYYVTLSGDEFLSLKILSYSSIGKSVSILDISNTIPVYNNGLLS